jgi:hypothetical protein
VGVEKASAAKVHDAVGGEEGGAEKGIDFIGNREFGLDGFNGDGEGLAVKQCLGGVLGVALGGSGSFHGGVAAAPG